MLVNIRSVLLVLFLQAILHSSFARFGDDEHWRARKRIDCDRERPGRELVCDGEPHCEDGRDEEGCSECYKSAFHCADDRCLPMSLRCDNHDDCRDGSDERDCSGSARRKREALRSDIPATIELIDTKATATQNYSQEILGDYSTNTDFSLDVFAYKMTRPERGLDARSVNYEGMRKVAFYIHGFRTYDLIDGLSMKDALAQGADDVDCVLIIDWRKGSYLLDPEGWAQHWPSALITEYKNVVFDNVGVVANMVARFIELHIPGSVKVHLIGFSLGGQIAGMAARTLKNRGRTIERISALDPSGPIFEFSLMVFPVDTTRTLRPSDATFVDVIHASKVLGMHKEAGHLDVYIEDSDCNFAPCLHHKAVNVYVASINSCSQIACPFGKLNESGRCEVAHHGQLASLGYPAHLYDGRGKHTVRYFYYIFIDKQYRISTQDCSMLLPVYLPAKDRVCRSPPTGSDCGHRPYLTECEQSCSGVKNKLVCSAGGITFHTGNGAEPRSQLGRGKVTSPVTWSGEKCKQPLS